MTPIYNNKCFAKAVCALRGYSIKEYNKFIYNTYLVKNKKQIQTAGFLLSNSMKDETLKGLTVNKLNKYLAKQIKPVNAIAFVKNHAFPIIDSKILNQKINKQRVTILLNMGDIDSFIKENNKRILSKGKYKNYTDAD